MVDGLMAAVIAITAGDVAGIGPEVIIRSVCGGQLPGHCVPLPIGPIQFFRRAATLCSIECSFELLPDGLDTQEIRSAAQKLWSQSICPVLRSEGVV